MCEKINKHNPSRQQPNSNRIPNWSTFDNNNNNNSDNDDIMKPRMIETDSHWNHITFGTISKHNV